MDFVAQHQRDDLRNDLDKADFVVTHVLFGWRHAQTQDTKRLAMTLHGAHDHRIERDFFDVVEDVAELRTLFDVFNRDQGLRVEHVQNFRIFVEIELDSAGVFVVIARDYMADFLIGAMNDGATYAGHFNGHHAREIK